MEELLYTAESPRVLHLATHGFFLENNEGAVRKWTLNVAPGEALAAAGSTQRGSWADDPWLDNLFRGTGPENPMLRSGIVLAGVNASLKAGQDEGLVSAEKILGMKLRGTDLVVLSACETGLGEVKSGEGVFGLRRAFILAGAKTVVMSLWSVPSAATTELMIAFYKARSEGKSKSETLRQAKQTQAAQGRHPLFWGAFVLLGNPE